MISLRSFVWIFLKNLKLFYNVFKQLFSSFISGFARPKKKICLQKFRQDDVFANYRKSPEKKSRLQIIPSIFVFSRTFILFEFSQFFSWNRSRAEQKNRRIFTNFYLFLFFAIFFREIALDISQAVQNCHLLTNFYLFWI